MGIYINMAMPASCYGCNCCITDSEGIDYCCLSMQDIEDINKRDDECPLVFVPLHGRLIDAGSLGMTDFEILSCQGNYKTALSMLLGKIEKAPAIIPAEEGET